LSTGLRVDFGSPVEPYKDFSAPLDNVFDKYQYLDEDLSYALSVVCRYLINKVNNSNPNYMNQVYVANKGVIVLDV
jgi:hypothetical protein